MSKKSVFTLQLFSLVNSSLNGPPTQGPYSFFFFFKSRLFYNPASSLVNRHSPLPKTVKTVKTVHAPPAKRWAIRLTYIHLVLVRISTPDRSVGDLT